MLNWLKHVDQILRGEATKPDKLSDEALDIPVGGVTIVLIVFGIIYGLCMGCFALINREAAVAFQQMLASSLKVPALFFLTLLVTFPSLYVFNALVGSRLNVLAVLRLLLAALAVNLAVLASLGPITAFFSVCSTSYAFIVLLNVVFFAGSGMLGLVFLLQTLHRISLTGKLDGSLAGEGNQQAESLKAQQAESLKAQGAESSEDVADEGEVQEVKPVVAKVVEEPGALDWIDQFMLGRHVKAVFGCWLVVFCLVGAQMGWILRPFIGDPDMPFEWFRERDSNFFEAVFQTLQNLFS
jgi:hypothetical protein